MSQLKVAKIVTGGILAGLVIIAVNVAAQFVLGHRVEADMNRWMPGAAARMRPAGSMAVVLGLILKLAIGTILVWLYAAARPTLGRGRTAASLVALTVWLLGAIFFSDFPLTGMWSWTTYAIVETLQLSAFLAAAWVAAWHYGED
jgi:hypothetical protein